jgi:transcriptional regulator with GAF, ATPase, and Fis domain
VIAPELLAEVFVEVADTLVEDFDLVEFLQMLTTRSSDLLMLASAGLLLADQRGTLQLMAASDERTSMLELYQLQAHEGPCQDCFTQGVTIIGADLEQATERWPRFAPHAVEAGYRSVHAFPLRLRDKVIGALNLFGTESGDMGTADARVVQALADVATIAILQERAIRRGDALTEQLQHALNSRVVIEQAKGALAQIWSCSPDEAFDIMRRYARDKGIRLSDVAQKVTTHRRSMPDLIPPPRML